MQANTTTICQTASYWTNSAVTSRHRCPAAIRSGSRQRASRTCGNGNWSTVSTAVTARTDTVATGQPPGARSRSRDVEVRISGFSCLPRLRVVGRRSRRIKASANREWGLASMTSRRPGSKLGAGGDPP
jgi:hypothetical protein